MDSYHRGHTGLKYSHLSVLTKHHVSHTVGKFSHNDCSFSDAPIYLSDELPSQLLQNKDRRMIPRFQKGDSGL